MKIKLNKSIVVVVICCLILSCFLALPSALTQAPNSVYTIVIDPGHGGIDGGTIGKNTGKDENSLNLAYAFCLREILEKYNIKIILTRTNLDGLYNPFATDKKINDMERRAEIINNANADLVISLHMNSFPLEVCRGAQVFYRENNTPAKALADSIQSIFIQTLPEARKNALAGDYYILNCTDVPSVIIECGYLSNPDEEKLLISENYKQLVCASIFIGILKYLSL